MRSATLSDFLPDFGPRPAEPAGMAEPSAPPRPAVEPVDTERLVAEAAARAEAALEARLVEEHSRQMDAERARHAGEIDRIMADLGAEAGARIAARLDEAQTRVTALVGDVVARILGTMLSEAMQKRSLEALAATITAAMSDAEALRIGIRGPLSLFEPVEQALGSRAAQVDFTDADGFDLTVSLGDTVIETRIAEWSSALAEVMA